MSDIRKRTGSKGTTYQVRYPSKAAKAGYAYKTFNTLKEARAFLEGGGTKAVNCSRTTGIRQVSAAVDRWLEICEKEGTDGNDPVTRYTLKNYKHYAGFMKAYEWPKTLQDLQPPDIVEFRSWLLTSCPSRYLARKTLTHFHSVLSEMALRGLVASNVASGISISSASRYDQPVTPPTVQEFRKLLQAADKLANSKNAQIEQAWRRYRPMLYLAGDTGMRPGEYLVLPRFNLSSTEVKVDRALERTGDRISVTKTPAGWRWIDLSPDVADMVQHYVDKHAAPSMHDLVFATAAGTWQSLRNWSRRGFDEACFKAGLIETVERDGRSYEKPRFSPYDLRHFYASMLIEQKVSLKRVQKLMGHTDISTTLNVYGHLIERAELADEAKTGLVALVGRKKGCGKSVARAN
ncbi:MAG: site-specific integrase [Rhizobiales bacterium]|nr:site-specific integrase [Hyphomicrobiales bacterium]